MWFLWWFLIHLSIIVVVVFNYVVYDFPTEKSWSQMNHYNEMSEVVDLTVFKFLNSHSNLLDIQIEKKIKRKSKCMYTVYIVRMTCAHGSYSRIHMWRLKREVLITTNDQSRKFDSLGNTFEALKWLQFVRDCCSIIACSVTSVSVWLLVFVYVSRMIELNA